MQKSRALFRCVGCAPCRGGLRNARRAGDRGRPHWQTRVGANRWELGTALRVGANLAVPLADRQGESRSTLSRVPRRNPCADVRNRVWPFASPGLARGLARERPSIPDVAAAKADLDHVPVIRDRIVCSVTVFDVKRFRIIQKLPHCSPRGWPAILSAPALGRPMGRGRPSCGSERMATRPPRQCPSRACHHAGSR